MNLEGREEHQGRFRDDGTAAVVDAGLKVHRTLGPGLLESAYEQCPAFELHRRGIAVERQVALPIVYDNLRLDAGYRLDLLVARSVIVEIKAVDALTNLHRAPLLTYLRLSKCRVGLLKNFNVVSFKDGFKRLVL